MTSASRKTVRPVQPFIALFSSIFKTCQLDPILIKNITRPFTRGRPSPRNREVHGDFLLTTVLIACAARCLAWTSGATPCCVVVYYLHASGRIRDVSLPTCLVLSSLNHNNYHMLPSYFVYICSPQFYVWCQKSMTIEIPMHYRSGFAYWYRKNVVVLFCCTSIYLSRLTIDLADRNYLCS